ncbi:MAG: hypothetical protein QM676_12640 [Novosphingobium sp.]
MGNTRPGSPSPIPQKADHPAGLDHNGFYVDSFHKVGGDWLIENRRLRTVWIAENSLLR